MKSILFIYGTTGGNTELVVDSVAKLLNVSGFRTKQVRVESAKITDITKEDILILASPTYGHGVLEANMEAFQKSLIGYNLSGKNCAVIGLGDPKYDAQYHLESVPILEEAIRQASGKLLLPSLRVSGTPVRHLDGVIPHWTNQLIDVLKK